MARARIRPRVAEGARGAAPRHQCPSRRHRCLDLEGAASRPQARSRGNRANHGRPRHRRAGWPIAAQVAIAREWSMRTRRYLFALVDAGGNVPPELGAVRRLVERGHAVTVLAEDSVASDVHATGATLRRWVHAPNRPDRRPENDPARDWECKYPWQLVDRLIATMLVGPAPRYARDVDAVLGQVRPDLVVCSMFCMGGMAAAEGAGIPFDVLLPNIYLFPAPGMPPFGLG